MIFYKIIFAALVVVGVTCKPSLVVEKADDTTAAEAFQPDDIV